MAFNPSANHITTAKGAGMPNQQGLNNPESYNGQGYNTFAKGHYHPTSSRYADVRPFYVAEGIEGDVKRFRTDFKLNSFTLKQPMIMPLELHQDFFSVPWSAMLDYWDLIYKVPLTGSDIPVDAHPIFRPLDVLLTVCRRVGIDVDSGELGTLNSYYDTSLSETTYHATYNWFMVLVLLFTLFSPDSVAKHCEISFPCRFDTGSGKSEYFSIDQFVAAFIRAFDFENNPTLVVRFTCSPASAATTDQAGSTYNIVCQSGADIFNVFTGVAAGQYNVTNITYDSGLLDTTIGSTLATLLGVFYQMMLGGLSEVSNLDPDISTEPSMNVTGPYAIDIKRLIAYQMCVAQYYSNPNVDVVATARDWKRNMKELAYTADSSIYAQSFTYRGSTHRYDVFSYRILHAVAQACVPYGSSYVGNSAALSAWAFMVNLFGMAHSLRNGDYFYSGRLEPLAVDATGSTSIPVNNNSVAALDTNKGLLYQRFINAVNRASGEIYEYMSSMAGVKPERILPQPNFIAHQVHNLGDEEIENTAGTNLEAGKTALYHSHTDNFVFEVFLDEPCVVLGLLSFQMPYIYPNFTNRLVWQRNRYDWFQAMLQDVGDQEIDSFELDSNLRAPREVIWAYTLRYAQFKYGVNHASGAFAAGKLPSYAMMPEMSNNITTPFMSPEVLRNHDNEFDDFYASLTDLEPSGRFHFIISFYNDVLDNSRQAAFPKLL